MASKIYELTPETHINVLSSGTPNTKPSLIFLHFFGGSSRIYLPLTTLLSPHFHTLSIDFRGWGSSTGPASPNAYHIHDLSSDIQTLLPQILPPSHPFILIGHSMGAKVAMYVASQVQSLPPPFPILLGLFLLAPAPPSPLILPEEIAAQQITAYDSIEAATFVTNNILSATELPESTVANVVADMMRGNQYAKVAWPKYAIKEDYVKEAREIVVPVLVLLGAQDKVETTERMKGEVLGNLVGVREEWKELRVVDGAGHLILLEKVDVVKKEIEEFVGKVQESMDA